MSGRLHESTGFGCGMLVSAEGGAELQHGGIGQFGAVFRGRGGYRQLFENAVRWICFLREIRKKQERNLNHRVSDTAVLTAGGGGSIRNGAAFFFDYQSNACIFSRERYLTLTRNNSYLELIFTRSVKKTSSIADQVAASSTRVIIFSAEKLNFSIKIF